MVVAGLAAAALRLRLRLRLKPAVTRLFNSSSISAVTVTVTASDTARPVVWKHIQHLVPYPAAYELQHALVQHKIDHPTQSLDWLLLLEHAPVYTTGRRQSEQEISDHTQDLLLHHHHHRPHQSQPTIFRTLRGGQLTFHGPGQLVGYPILNLKSINLSARMYVDLLMDLVRTVLMHPTLPTPIASVSPKDDPSLPVGIFINSDAQKIASIGVQIRRRTSCHGFALNVTEDSLAGFRSIVACGLENTRMTSVQSVLKQRRDAAADTNTLPRGGPSSTVQVLDLVLPTVEVFGRLTGRAMRQMDPACEELDPVGYGLVDRFLNAHPSST